jgi:hypothetical protein
MAPVPSFKSRTLESSLALRVRSSNDDFAHELVALVDARVKLVVDEALAVLHGPLGIDVFLRTLVGLPRNWHDAFLDCVGLFTLVALDRRLHQRRVDDLAMACQVAMRQQLLLHLVE